MKAQSAWESQGRLSEEVDLGKEEGTGKLEHIDEGPGLWVRWQRALCAKLRGPNLFLTGDGEPSFVCVLSWVQLFSTPWTVACQAPHVREIFQGRMLVWVAIFLLQGNLPTQELNLHLSLASPALAGRFFITSATWEPSWALLIRMILGLQGDQTSQP